MKEVKELKFLSLDAETNGLWGKPFTIAVTGYDANGDERESLMLFFLYRFAPEPKTSTC